jgi:hypothetical protein
MVMTTKGFSGDKDCEGHAKEAVLSLGVILT